MAIRPRDIRLEASSFCQLRCPSCPTTSGAIHPAIGGGFLRAEDFERLLDENPRIRSVELSNYGEIFLNPELPRILELAFRRRVRIEAGNGVNLNTVREPTLEAVVKYRLRTLTCSIDGATPEVYSRYRVRGSLDQVLGNLRKINEYKGKYRSRFPILRWQYIVFEHNQHEVAAARALARSLDMSFDLKLSWDETAAAPDSALTTSLFGVASRSAYREREGRDYMHGICGQLWNHPQINWDGKVLGCCRNFWGDFGGNAFADGLVAAVNSDGMRYARDMLRGRRPIRPDLPCATCDIYLTMKTTGRYLSARDVAGPPNLFRRLARRLARTLGLTRPPRA